MMSFIPQVDIAILSHVFLTRASRSSGIDMITRIISTDEEFFSLREAWNALHAEAQGNIYQTFEWQSQWWKLYGPKFKLLVLTGWEEQRLIGVFPCFVVREQFTFFHLSRLRFLGDYPVSGEYPPLVLHSFTGSFSPHAASFCREVLTSGKCDFIDFEKFPSSSLFMKAILEGVRGQGLVVVAIDRYRPGVQIHLPKDWETYEKEHTSHARHRMRRDERAILEGGAEFEVITDPDDVQAFDDYVALHTRYWTKRGPRGHFVNRDRFEEFHHAIAPELMHSGAERLYFLRSNGIRFVALQVFFMHGVCTAYLGGRDPDHPLSAHGPGKVMIRHVMKDAIAEGCRVFDCLRGVEEYKVRIGSTPANWHGRITMARHGVSGMKGLLFVLFLKARLALDRSNVGKRYSWILSWWAKRQRQRHTEPG